MDKRYFRDCEQDGSFYYLILISGILLLILTGCSSLRESSKYQFTEGVFKLHQENAATTRVYVDLLEDTITIYPVISTANDVVLDSLNKVVVGIPQERKKSPGKIFTFYKPSFDIDVLTIPFKFRPGTAGIPPQLNTTFQGAVYVGGRNDVFRINYKRTPLNNYRRSFNHFGYSFGVFSGIGASTVNEIVTGGKIGYEYEGVVLLYGVAGIVGINNFTLGLTLGLDHLLDKNRSEWIYQQKPWVGLAFGLNLN